MDVVFTIVVLITWSDCKSQFVGHAVQRAAFSIT